jgi:zinc transport system ATP-binding protein
MDTLPTSTGSTPLIEAKGVSVRAGERELVSNIDLAIHAGEIVTLIGPNGAGKTTMIRTILGLSKPHTGTVTRRPDLSVGYMPQRLSIDPTLPLPVSRFLALSGRAGGGRRREVLNEVGASHVWDTALTDISGGEFQRVLLARALLREPDLLVLDEPAQAIDVTGQADLYQMIGDIRDRRGCGILMVSHDLHLVMSATDRVVCINTHLCCAGEPATVSRDPAYIALFGEHVSSFALYQHHHDHHHDIDGSVVGEEDGQTVEPHSHG